jgi:hypothetical protein
MTKKKERKKENMQEFQKGAPNGTLAALCTALGIKEKEQNI